MISIIDTNVDCTNHLDRLKTRGIDTVIRYISRGMTSKVIRVPEARAFHVKNMALGIVYEGAGDNPSAFNVGTGLADANFAKTYLPTIGMPVNTMIWFAVDYDVGVFDVNDRIFPYFEGVKAALAGTPYRVGVYGSGAVGFRIVLRKLAEASWLACSYGWWGSRHADEWTLKQHLPTRDYAGIDSDPDEIKPGADIGAFVPFASSPNVAQK